MKSVPKYKIINGKKYKLSSQDISNARAKKLAKELRENNWFYAKVVPMKGSYRVYTRKHKAPR